MSHAIVPVNAPLASVRDPLRAAFLRVESVIRNVPPERATPPNLDSMRAAQLVLHAVPRTAQLRPRMEALAHELDLARIDRCADLALAYCHVRGAYVRAARRTSRDGLRREGLALRRRLRMAAELAALLVEPGERLVMDLHMTHSYERVSQDLTALVRFFTEHALALGARVPVRGEDVERAGALAALLLEGDDGEHAQAVAGAVHLAHQTFAALADSYAELRRAVQFLRAHEGDAERIAPSLYSERARKARRRTAKPAASDDSADTPNT